VTKAAAAEPTVNEILRVALDLFSSRGYDGTSIRDIAEAVGIRGSSMYNHFPAKQAILWELAQRAFTQLNESWHQEESLLSPSATPHERLAAFVRADVRYHAVHTNEASIINAQIRSLAPEHRTTAVRRRAEYEAILTDIVHGCLGASAAADPRAKLTIYAILQMCAAVAGWYRPDGPLGIDEICCAYAELATKLVS
jgi:AcrR family transcriptional regulator